MQFTSFETAIKTFLDQFASEDKEFANKYANPNKSIEECCKYIFQEVEKGRKKSERCVGVPEDEVYGLAIHYYDEEDIKVEGPKTKAKAVVPASEPKESQSSEEITKETEKKPARKPRKKKAVVEEDEDIPDTIDIPLF